MKVTYIVRENLNLYPPCISQILMLKDLGIDVTVISGDINDNLKTIFKQREIEYSIIGAKRIRNKHLGKVQSYYNYRKNIMRLIKEKSLENNIFWFGTADSAFALYPLVNDFKFVLNILELYDTNRFYRNNINRIAKNAVAVVANELNRAYIMKNWYGLEKRPFIMPNKPYEHPKMKNIDLDDVKLQKIISTISSSKIVIYQGLISSDRDLKKLALALKELDDTYILLLMGKEVNNSIKELQNIYDKTYYIGYIPAPDHLKITSHAYIGIANYDDSTLNNIYCAPNKTYEYAGYGIPVLCSNVPGLINSIGDSNAGICIDFESVDSIKEAIRSMDNYYDFYSQNAKAFFEDTDNYAMMREIISIL